jgi:hypothetical protein
VAMATCARCGGPLLDWSCGAVRSNDDGLHYWHAECGVSMDEERHEARAALRGEGPTQLPHEETFLAPLEYRVVHAYVVVRAQPTRASRELSRRECGAVVLVAAQRRGWLRLAHEDGWMLIDASALNLGVLLVRHEHSVPDTSARRQRVRRETGAHAWADPTSARDAENSVHRFDSGQGVVIAATCGGWGKCWLDLPAAACTARVRAAWVLLDDLVRVSDAASAPLWRSLEQLGQELGSTDSPERQRSTRHAETESRV